MAALKSLRSFTIAICVAVGLAAPAHADMKAFNAAVKAGDYRAAAVVARETWPTLDSGNPDIAVIAREFAWAAMRGGDAENARIYAGYLVEHGSKLQPADAMPLTSAVLKAWADFAISDSRETRKAFIEALNGRLQGASVDIISLVAAENLYTLSIRAGNWQDARDAALAAAKLAERGQRTTIVQKYRADIASLAAGIMDQKQRESYDQLVELDRMMYNEAVQPANARDSNAFWSLHDTALAWRKGLAPLFPSLKDSLATESDLHSGVEARHPAPASGLPLCKLDGSQPQTVLSLEKLFVNVPPHGVAAVVVDFAIVADGKVRDPKILVAIPNAALNEAALKAVQSWRYKVVKGVDPKSCEFAREHNISTIQWNIPTALR